MYNIIDHFERYFKIVSANTPELVQECHKLRYQVFCVENHYLTDNEYEDFAEIDEFDHRSTHKLILHKESGLYAATVRLVLPHPQVELSTYPIESHLTASCRQEYDRLMTAPRKQVAEISRLLISKHFRQRIGEDKIVHGINNDFGMLAPKPKRQFTAEISIGLFKAIVQMSAEQNMGYWLALMEPQLIRLLARIGIHFNHLSESIKYCGKRHVCFENAAEVLRGIQRQRPDIWTFITENGRYTLQQKNAERHHRQASYSL